MANRRASSNMLRFRRHRKILIREVGKCGNSGLSCSHVVSDVLYASRPLLRAHPGWDGITLRRGTEQTVSSHSLSRLSHLNSLVRGRGGAHGTPTS